MHGEFEPHEATLEGAQFNAAEARRRYADAAGLPEAKAAQQTEPGMRTDVVAVKFDPETGEAKDVLAIPRTAEEGGGETASSLKSENVAEVLRKEGKLEHNEPVFIADLKPRKHVGVLPNRAEQSRAGSLRRLPTAA